MQRNSSDNNKPLPFQDEKAAKNDMINTAKAAVPKILESLTNLEKAIDSVNKSLDTLDTKNPSYQDSLKKLKEQLISAISEGSETRRAEIKKLEVNFPERMNASQLKEMLNFKKEKDKIHRILDSAQTLKDKIEDQLENAPSKIVTNSPQSKH